MARVPLESCPEPRPASAPIILDVEASGFGRGSYPIEIGVALSDGRTQCFLVRPETEWTHWDAQAASLHGITRELLLRKGRPAREVAVTLNTLLGDATVFTDAWGMDSSWIALLYHCASVRQHFRLEALASLLDDAQREAWAEAKQRVRAEMDLTRHRASADALVIQHALERTRSLRRTRRHLSHHEAAACFACEAGAVSATSPESS